jgi:fatty acid elongase 3
MEFLENFQIDETTPLMETFIPFTISGSYLIIIFTLYQIMKNKETGFTLRFISTIHNLFMTLLSLFLLLGMVYSVFDVYTKISTASQFQFLLLCDSEKQINLRGPMFFFSYLFYLSKIYELFDTVLIVLKKGKLMFLHVYHHFITL